MIIGNVLFLEESLDRYLRAQEGAVGNHVRQKVSRVDLIKSDAEIVHALLPEARVAPLKVDFDNLGALLGEAVASRRQQLASLEDLKNRI